MTTEEIQSLVNITLIFKEKQDVLVKENEALKAKLAMLEAQNNAKVTA